MPEKFSTPVRVPSDLIEYLVINYEVSKERAVEIVQSEQCKLAIVEGIKYGSFIWFVGDHIADIMGLEPLGSNED